MKTSLRIVFIILISINVAVFGKNDHLSPQTVSLDFPKIEIKDLLQLIAKNSAKNMVISPNVRGSTSINLKNVSWDEALNVILDLGGLTKKEDDNIIFIYPISEEVSKGCVRNCSKVIFLHFAKAKDVVNDLKSSGVLSHTGNITCDIRTNSLLIEDNPAKINEINQLINSIDIPIKQILISAKIVSADDEFIHDLGLKFGTINNDNNHEGNADSSLERIDAGHFEFTIAKLDNERLLDLELEALENEGRGKVISSPKLLTQDRKIAYIESGSEIPYQEKASRGATSVAFKKAVLSLKVKPEIIARNKLNLVLQVSQDKVSSLMVSGVPAIDTRKIETQVEVNDGETIVLGGIYEWANDENELRTPVLGKIPLIGELFKDKEIKKQRKELLIFVSPTIEKS